MRLASLIAAVDELVADDPGGFVDRADIVELKRQVARLEAIDARATEAFDRGGDWTSAGARSSIQWLAAATNGDKKTLGRQRRLGRAMAKLPVAAEAWLAGTITADHVGLLAGARNPRTADDLADDEAMLVGQAKSLWFRQFEQAITYWRLIHDPDGSDGDHHENIEKRKLSYAQGMNGCWFGALTLDAISGEIFNNVLRAIEQDLFVEDWAEAKQRLGREPKIDDLSRTHLQRQADAVVEMARRAAAMPPDARKPDPLFSILVDYPTMHGLISELESGTVIPPSGLVPWLSTAEFERVTFDAASRVLDVGAHRRLFTGATRRALEVRDRTCYHPYCDVPSHQCQADHILEWSNGGPTTTANGRMACGFHNRSRNTRPPPDDEP